MIHEQLLLIKFIEFLSNGRWKCICYNKKNLYDICIGGAELQKVVQDPRITIEQLQPNTNYSFYVVAYNDKSASQHSKTVTYLTEEDG